MATSLGLFDLLTGKALGFFGVCFKSCRSFSQAVLDTAKQNGYVIVNWNADSNDWQYGAYDDPQSIIDNLSSQEGSKMSSKIILLHDRPLTALALKEIIRFYKRKGYWFVNMRDCLGESAYF